MPFKHMSYHLCLWSSCVIYCRAPLGSFKQDPVALTGFGAVLLLVFITVFFFFPFSLDLGQLPLRNTLFRGGFVVFLFIVVPFFLFLSVLLFSV